MPIKEREILSPADFDAAVLRLRLSVSEVAKTTGVSRSYLSEFRNGDRKLRPEHQAKLRDYFEEKGIEFEDAPADQREEDQAAARAIPSSPHERVQVAPIRYIAIRSDLDDNRVRHVFDEIDRNDELIAELCEDEAIRDSSFFGSEASFDDDTQDKIRELFALLAANYVLVRYLSSTENLLSTPPATSTLHEVLLDSIEESLSLADVEPEAPQAANEETGQEKEAQA